MTTPIERGAEAIRAGGAEGSDAELRCDARAVFESIDVPGLMRVLAENGMDDQGSNPHSWRCEHPDRYPGYCTCATDVATAIKAHLLDGGDREHPR